MKKSKKPLGVLAAVVWVIAVAMVFLAIWSNEDSFQWAMSSLATAVVGVLVLGLAVGDGDE